MGNSILKICPMCHKSYSMVLNSEESRGYLNYLSGNGLIQEMLPSLNPLEREFIKTGYCPTCQNIIFGSQYTSERIKSGIEENEENNTPSIVTKPTTKKSVYELVKELSNDDLIACCNDIFDWKNTGYLPEDRMDEILRENEGTVELSSAEEMERFVIDEAIKRFKKIVLLLFGEYPKTFLK